jgi:proline iminopeptidase
VRLWYKVAGTAQAGQAPLLYLHGGPGYNSYSFEKTVGTQLERHVQMIYLDERGCGRSERPSDHNYAMPTLLDDIEALRRHLGVPQLSLMGHSFGGTIALEYAARHPGQVSKLIILDGAADMPRALGLWERDIKRKYRSVWQTLAASDELRAQREAIRQGDQCAIGKAEFAVDMLALGKIDGAAFHHWQQFHNQRYAREQEALDAASGLRNTGELGSAYFAAGNDFLCYHFSAYRNLTMPVLVIVGRYDEAVGADSMRSLAERVPQAQFDEFTLSAHFPYAEQGPKFDRDVPTFLAPK